MKKNTYLGVCLLALTLILVGCEQAILKFNPTLPEFITVESITLLDETGEVLSVNPTGLMEVISDIEDVLVSNGLSTAANYDSDWTGGIFTPSNDSIKPATWETIKRELNQGVSSWVFISEHVDYKNIKITCIAEPIMVSKISLINKNDSLTEDDITTIKSVVNPVLVSSGLVKDDDLATAWTNLDFVPTKSLISPLKWETTSAELSVVLPLAYYPVINDDDLTNVTIELESFANVAEVDWQGLSGTSVLASEGIAGIPAITIDKNFNVTQTLPVTFSDSEISLDQKLTAVKNAILESLPEMPEGIAEITSEDIEIELDAESNYSEATVTITVTAEKGYALEVVDTDGNPDTPSEYVLTKTINISATGSFEGIISFSQMNFPNASYSVISNLRISSNLTGSATASFSVGSATPTARLNDTASGLLKTLNNENILPAGIKELTSGNIRRTSNTYTQAKYTVTFTSEEGLLFENGTNTETASITVSGSYTTVVSVLDVTEITTPTSTKAKTWSTHNRAEYYLSGGYSFPEIRMSFHGDNLTKDSYKTAIENGLEEAFDGNTGVSSVTVNSVSLGNYNSSSGLQRASASVTLKPVAGYNIYNETVSKTISVLIDVYAIQASNTYYVSSASTTNNGKTGTASLPFASIQKAFDALTEYTSSGTMNIKVKGTLTGTNATLDFTPSSRTYLRNLIIGGESASSIATLNGGDERQLIRARSAYSGQGATITLQNIILTNGKGVDGGAVMLSSNSNTHLTMSSSSTIQNSSATRGGGIYLGSGTDFTGSSAGEGNSYIKGNTASNGGGVYINIGSSGYDDFTMSTGLYIQNNTATYSGGGIYVAPSSLVRINAGYIIDNKTLTEDTGQLLVGGGGVWIGGSARVYMTGGFIYRNTTAELGGGVMMTGGTLNMSGGRIGSTSYANGNFSKFGGGIYMSSGILNFSGSAYITYNNASENTGGVRYDRKKASVNRDVIGHIVNNQRGDLEDFAN